nr:retinol dehydrogenase 12 [Quercus suber]
MSRYAKVHENTKGPGDARPTALQIVEDEGLTGQLTNKVFLVTGVSSGLGIETLRALYATGAHVYGTVRNRAKGQKVVDEIKGTTSSAGEITLIDMEMDSLASVRRGAETFLSLSHGQLNVLVNNAGVMTTPEGVTRDGFETQFGTNHLGHFLLFQLVRDALLASSMPAFPSRVVSVSSIGHTYGQVNFGDYQYTRTPYDPKQAYGQSKTANIYLANAIERRYGARGLHATSLHPGGIWTALQEHMPAAERAAYEATPAVVNYMKSPAQGAATSVWAAIGAEWRDKGGVYLADCMQQGPAKRADGQRDLADEGYVAWAFDEEKEERLWRDSCELVGVKDDTAAA